MNDRMFCPKCGASSFKFSRNVLQPCGGNQQKRSVMCLACGHSWLEIYDLELTRIIDSPTKEPDK